MSSGTLGHPRHVVTVMADELRAGAFLQGDGTGLRILEQGSIPAVDDWSFTAAGAPWMNHEWLVDVVLGLACTYDRRLRR